MGRRIVFGENFVSKCCIIIFFENKGFNRKVPSCEATSSHC